MAPPKYRGVREQTSGGYNFVLQVWSSIYDTRKQAVREYKKKAREYLGDEAKLNIGVHKYYTRYKAELRVEVGRFNSPEEAARAYDKKALELLGKKARLNFPEEVDVDVSDDDDDEQRKEIEKEARETGSLLGIVFFDLLYECCFEWAFSSLDAFMEFYIHALCVSVATKHIRQDDNDMDDDMDDDEEDEEHLFTEETKEEARVIAFILGLDFFDLLYARCLKETFPSQRHFLKFCGRALRLSLAMKHMFPQEEDDDDDHHDDDHDDDDDDDDDDEQKKGHRKRSRGDVEVEDEGEGEDEVVGEVSFGYGQRKKVLCGGSSKSGNRKRKA